MKKDFVKEAEIELLAEVFHRTRENPEKGKEFVAALDAKKEAQDRFKELQAEIFK